MHHTYSLAANSDLYVGYLITTHVVNWTIVLDLCQRTSLNAVNSKEAAKALRKEFM
jgi:hypothetical protein